VVQSLGLVAILFLLSTVHCSTWLAYLVSAGSDCARVPVVKGSGSSIHGGLWHFVACTQSLTVQLLSSKEQSRGRGLSEWMANDSRVSSANHLVIVIADIADVSFRQT